MVEEAVLREEKSKKQSNERKVLIGVLSALALAIVGLVVVIILLNVDREVEDKEYTITDENQVVARCNEINDSYKEGSEYDLAWAVTEFENSLSESAKLQKMYLSICYARFLYKNEGDLEKAVRKLKVFEDVANAEGGEVAISYYVAMRGIYEQAGDEEKAKYYDDIVGDLMPKDTRTIEEMMEDSYEQNYD